MQLIIVITLLVLLIVLFITISKTKKESYNDMAVQYKRPTYQQDDVANSDTATTQYIYPQNSDTSCGYRQPTYRRNNSTVYMYKRPTYQQDDVASSDTINTQYMYQQQNDDVNSYGYKQPTYRQNNDTQDDTQPIDDDAQSTLLHYPDTQDTKNLLGKNQKEQQLLYVQHQQVIPQLENVTSTTGPINTLPSPNWHHDRYRHRYFYGGPLNPGGTTIDQGHGELGEGLFRGYQLYKAI